MSRSLALEFASRDLRVNCVCPGWVRTDMGGADADLAVDESVTSLRRVIQAANASHNGKFLNYGGEQLSW